VSQLGFIEALQHLRTPPLDLLLGAVTMLGDERVVVAGAGLLYLCVQRRLGLRALALFFVSAIVNEAAKLWAATPRPFVVGAPHIVPGFAWTGEGWAFPSGHSQTVFALGMYLALSLRQRRWWLLAAAVWVLVPFSRMYLGLHWPVDVLGGAAIGSILGAGMHLLTPAGRAPEPRPWPGYVLLALPALGLALGAAGPDGPSTTVRAGGGLAALLLGYTVLMEWLGGYEPPGTTGARLARGLLGVAGTGVVAGALEAALPHTMLGCLVAAALPILCLALVWPYALQRLVPGGDGPGARPDLEP